MYLPDKRKNRNYNIVQRGNRPTNKNYSNSGLMAVANLFGSTNPNNYALRTGRVHCQSIEKKAVLVDAQGNKIILKEHQTNFNTDKDTRGIEYCDDGRRFRRK